MPYDNKNSYVLKQTCDFYMQGCLSTYDDFVTTRH